MEEIKKYFSYLSDIQIDQLSSLYALYVDWNSKINVISRKDIDNLYLHHVLHSLAVVKMVRFKKGTSVLDLGTGGGFPGIPCAILCPEAHFTLIDGTNKKITVCKEVSKAIGLGNVRPIQQRAEEHKDKHDFVITRAVATLDKLWMWSRRLIHDNQKNSIPNGLLALKGGNIKQELKLLHKSVYRESIPITNYFKEPYFEGKHLIYVQH
jgi:16S rRNA (guanine527-N7)-methyltransferase